MKTLEENLGVQLFRRLCRALQVSYSDSDFRKKLSVGWESKAPGLTVTVLAPPSERVFDVRHFTAETLSHVFQNSIAVTLGHQRKNLHAGDLAQLILRKTISVWSILRSMIVLDTGKLVSFLLGPCNADRSPSVTIH